MRIIVVSKILKGSDVCIRLMSRMVCEAFREGKLILVNANLASQKLEHEHQERMIDRLLEYNQQTASVTGYFHTHPSE